MEEKLFAFVIVFQVTCCHGAYKEESTLSAPYFLKNGEIYRDKVTLQTAQKAAVLAKLLQQDDVYDKRPNVSRIISPEFFKHENFTYGETKSDEDIFDFIDSRFLNPPNINRYNHPLAQLQRHSLTYNPWDFTVTQEERTFSIKDSFAIAPTYPTNSDEPLNSYSRFALLSSSPSGSTVGRYV